MADRPDVVLGAMYFGTKQDDEASFALLDRFVERGGRWIDTADAYAFWIDPSGLGGAGEECLGRWFEARPGVRERVLLSTKVGVAPSSAGGPPEGLSAAVVARAAADSLRRLRTDRIDLYWAHAEDRSVQVGETVEAFGELVTAGSVARVGASNHATWRVDRGRAAARELGLAGWSALQLRRSYVQPRPGAELPDQGHVFASEEALDYALAEDLDVWAYTPLVNGAYVRADRPFPEAYEHPGTTRRLAVLGEIAAETGATANQVVLAWLMGGEPGISPVVGVSRAEQLDEALEARDLRLSPEQRLRLDTPG